MNNTLSPEALAALAICESILLSLTDNHILDEEEMTALLSDAATAHRESARTAPTPNGHEAAAVLIEGIRDGGNSVRRGMRDDPDEPTIS